MANIEQLKNSGFLRLGDDQQLEEKTVIVIGLARSGTSIVGGALAHLGVFMGDKACAPVYEDVYLSTAIEDKDETQVEQIIEDYNAQHSIWGLKRPSVLEHLDLINEKTRNPHYIIIFRDIFSIANRNRISANSDVFASMKNSLQEYNKVIEFLSKSNAPALILAYDKALNNSETLVPTLADFCGITASDEQVQNAIAFISPNPQEYLNASRVTRSLGAIDRVTDESVSGWARYINNERVAEVALMVNGEEVARTKANGYRQDLVDNNVHSTGKCAYLFTNLPDGCIKAGAEVRVKVSDDIVELKNSPAIYE